PAESEPDAQREVTTTTGSGAEPVGAAPSECVSIPGYEILGVLGQGGMGVVYKAYQLRLKRFVAVKMLAQVHVGLDQLDRFRREAEAAARLQHPHIAQIYEIGEAAGRP